VAILSKVYAICSNSVCAEGGTNVVLKEKDSYDLHAWDSIGDVQGAEIPQE
jgi:succinate dehydrogenase/fumarate reductase flavoprotein subunit